MITDYTKLNAVTRYTVKPGKKNFRPIENPLPVFGAKGFEVYATFDRGGWCSIEDWNGDLDWYDWQKLKGLTRFFSPNNKQSAMFAFRFDKEPEHYQVAAYTNDEDGRFVASNYVTIEAQHDSIAAKCVFDSEGYAHYTASTQGGEYINAKHRLKPFKLSRRIGTYAGGYDNAPGEFGGRAVKEMSIDITFEILK